MPTRRDAPDDRTVKESSRRAGSGGAASNVQIDAYWNGGSLALTLGARGEVFVGRGDACAVRIDHHSVSRKHALLRLEPPMRVEDLGSSNGTWVDGVQIAEGALTALGASGVFEVGSVIVVARAHDEAEAPSATAKRGAMEAVEKLVDVVARSAISVVFLGETGVGKTVLAERMHRTSKRASGPFLSVNCAALPEQLLESELFGHERGAFTGATQTKLGLLEAADGGTLFLDEVGEMPLATQSKILRVLESGDVTRVGATKPRKVDVRFLSATNKDLKIAVERGEFRSDLYFRLDGISITVPPLRERMKEIRPLAEAFLAEAAKDLGKSAPVLSPDAVLRLERHAWPGNVRELKNVMVRSALLATYPTLRADDLHFEGAGGARHSSEGAAMTVTSAATREKDDERQRVLDALDACAWNQTRAAERLGISRRTLLNRLDEFQIKRPRK